MGSPKMLVQVKGGLLFVGLGVPHVVGVLLISIENDVDNVVFPVRINHPVQVRFGQQFVVARRVEAMQADGVILKQRDAQGELFEHDQVIHFGGQGHIGRHPANSRVLRIARRFGPIECLADCMNELLGDVFKGFFSHF